jgi:hypothetical protein
MKRSRSWLSAFVFCLSAAAAIGSAVVAYSDDCVLKCKMIEWRRLGSTCEQYFEAGSQGFTMNILPPENGVGTSCFPSVIIHYHHNCTCSDLCTTEGNAYSGVEGFDGACDFGDSERIFCECIPGGT